MSKIENLTWLPWVGKDFKNNERRLLIVGESHYAIGETNKEYQKSLESKENKKFTREIIDNLFFVDDPQEEAYSQTFKNINSVIAGSSEIEANLLWRQVAFYNFIPILMDYRVKERPKAEDFMNAWKPFIELVKLLQPTDCIFMGVQAAKKFDNAMDNLQVKYKPIEMIEDKINNTCPRTANITLNNTSINISFIRHPSQYFSFNEWHDFLCQKHNKTLKFLKTKLKK